MNTIPGYWYFVPAAALFALAMALYFYRFMKKQPDGNDRMREIAGYVREGATAYLKQQYKTVSIVFVVLFFHLCHPCGLKNSKSICPYRLFDRWIF